MIPGVSPVKVWEVQGDAHEMSLHAPHWPIPTRRRSWYFPMLGSLGLAQLTVNCFGPNTLGVV